MNTVIKVEHLSKQYRLGAVSTGTLSHDVNRWWYRIRGKEDPYLKIGDVNDRTQTGSSEYVWALRNINFDVQKGEVLGVIGRNGAGKSTLLKILSRTTAPTTGSVKIKGRVASLLEVGTGFHPELTGRENVFLNGAILGMTKKEIAAKFDEIVDFAGVERYIDTPVKRYSSGMYVRLAFAVAAHLEPEILIVDEVLAVGDAEFQSKCLGKMKQVSQTEGRTILFVSHNLTAVKNLCTSALYLQNGQLAYSGDTEKVINYYLRTGSNRTMSKYWDGELKAPGNEFVKFKSVVVNAPDDKITVTTPFDIEIEFLNLAVEDELNISLHFYTISGELLFNSISEILILRKGLCKGVCKVPGNLLNDGIYYISIMLVKNSSVILYNLEEAVSIEVNDERPFSKWHHKWEGYVRPILDFPLVSI